MVSLFPYRTGYAIPFYAGPFIVANTSQSGQHTLKVNVLLCHTV